jgi:hypothetical protein
LDDIRAGAIAGALGIGTGNEDGKAGALQPLPANGQGILVNAEGAVKKIHVFTDPEFENLIPPLTEQEFAQLAANIRTYGFRDPLTCWRDPATEKYILLDGHNRQRIFEQDKIALRLKHPARPPVWNVINLSDREAALLWVRENQLGRRNLTDDQRAIMLDQLLEQRSKIAQRKAAAKAREARLGAVSAKTAKLEKHDNREATASEGKVSVHKLRMARKIRDTSPSLAAEVLAGKKSLRDAIRELKGKSAFPDLKIGDEVYVDGHPDCPAIRKVLALNALTIDLGDFGIYRRDTGRGENEAIGRHIYKVATPDDRLQLAGSKKQKEERTAYYASIAARVAEVRNRFVEKGWPCEVDWDRGSWNLKFTSIITEQLEAVAAALPPAPKRLTPG